MLTEPQAWLEIAKYFEDSPVGHNNPTGLQDAIGLCDRIWVWRDERKIDWGTADSMTNRIYAHIDIYEDSTYSYIEYMDYDESDPNGWNNTRVLAALFLRLESLDEQMVYLSL